MRRTGQQAAGIAVKHCYMAIVLFEPLEIAPFLPGIMREDEESVPPLVVHELEPVFLHQRDDAVDCFHRFPLYSALIETTQEQFGATNTRMRQQDVCQPFSCIACVGCGGVKPWCAGKKPLNAEWRGIDQERIRRER